jgi:hypothetical protein
MVNLGGPPGQETVVLADSVTVVLHGVSEADGALQVQVTATALAALPINEAEIRNRIKGMTVAEAEAELAELSNVQIDLWPGWVDTVPKLDFRIDIVPEVQGPPGPTPQESLN